MRRDFRILWALALTTLCTATAQAGAGGGNPYAFMKQGVGARGLGLGGAYLSQVTDGSSGYWNPAGYSYQEKGTQIYLSHMSSGGQDAWQKSYEPSVNYLSVAGRLLALKNLMPSFEDITYAVTYHQFALDGFQRTTQDGSGNVTLLDGEFADKQSTLGVHAATQFFGDLVAVGFSLNQYFHTLDAADAHGTGVTIGAQSNLSKVLDKDSEAMLGVLYDVKMGVLTRVYMKEKWEHVEESIPPQYGLDFSFALNNRTSPVRALLALGTFKQGVNSPQFHAGSEVVFRPMTTNSESISFVSATLRAGVGGLFSQPMEEWTTEDMNQFSQAISFGLGGEMLIGKKPVSMDFTVSVTEFGNRSVLSIGFDY